MVASSTPSLHLPSIDPVIHPSVLQALRAGTPIVALESTIIAHGLPYPTNLHTARLLESTIRQYNATPATIAVINGSPHIGLTSTQLAFIASPKTAPLKLARRNLPIAYASGATGATTVSATMAIAAMVGISVFATGGIGGVHRGVDKSWDISADISALSDTSMIVVCAGAKSILDVPKTLESLETASVPVLVLGSKTFPSFYSRGTLPAPSTIHTPEQAAKVLWCSRKSKAKSGVLMAVPIPTEYEADGTLVERATKKALIELEHTQPRLEGKHVTPFLLKRIAEITRGVTIDANVQLVKNNAIVASKVACALSQLNMKARKTANVYNDVPTAAETLIVEAKDTRGIATPETRMNPHAGIPSGAYDDLNLSTNFARENGPTSLQPPYSSTGKKPQLLLVGCVALDIHCDIQRGSPLLMRASNVGKIRQCLGGVGGNVAQAAARCGTHVTFISAVGDDVIGSAVRQQLQASKIQSLKLFTFQGKRTATCCVVHDGDGDMAVGVGDMNDIFGSDSVSLVASSGSEIEQALMSAKIAGMDANLSIPDMLHFSKLCMKYGVPCWLEPTTPHKSAKAAIGGILPSIRYISPNLQELSSLSKALGADSTVNSVADQARYVLDVGGGGKNGQQLLVTCGEKGVRTYRLVCLDGIWELEERHYQGEKVVVNGNTTGAGDCFAGTCMGVLSLGGDIEEAVKKGIKAAEALCAGVARSPFLLQAKL